MNARRSIYWGLAAALACAGAAAAQPAIHPPPAPAPETTAAMASAAAATGYPSFASIPTYPKDVRPLAAWKASVLAIKADGAHLVRLIAADPWTLANTEAWAADERSIATPPPPMSAGDTEAFVAAMRQRAMPPPPLHHTAGAPPAVHP